jgi:uncharacterized protein (TIGR03437 family)
MTSPRTVLAMLDAVPYVPPAAVGNGAGGAPGTGVAPGSIVSVYGVNLTPVTLVGPSNQLVQTLGGLTLRAGDRLLPLIFVSPSQINAQLPADMALGNAVLTISSTGQQDVQSSFTVVPDAPGVFSAVSAEGKAFALATHADGSVVSTAAPVQQGEAITVYGTGFGPTVPSRPEGLPVAASPALTLQDAASVQVGGVSFDVQAGYAVPGAIGVDAVVFVVGSNAPGATDAALTVTVNGQVSNSVLIPLQ